MKISLEVHRDSTHNFHPAGDSQCPARNHLMPESTDSNQIYTPKMFRIALAILKIMLKMFRITLLKSRILLGSFKILWIIAWELLWIAWEFLKILRFDNDHFIGNLVVNSKIFFQLWVTYSKTFPKLPRCFSRQLLKSFWVGR